MGETDIIAMVIFIPIMALVISAYTWLFIQDLKDINKKKADYLRRFK